MAYAAIASLVQTLKQIIDNDNLHLDLGKKRQIESLLEKACSLQAFLEDSSFVISNEAVQCLEPQIRNAACRAEDLIELRVMESEFDREEGFLDRIFPAVQCLVSIFRPPEGDMDLQEAIEEVDSIMEEMMKIKNAGVQEQRRRNSLRAESSSTLTASASVTMVGFDDDLMQLKDRLMIQQSQLQVIPIVGMGGTGKTTLARSIYDDPFIKRHFDVLAWITMSQEYYLRDILLSLLDCTTELNDSIREQRDENLATLFYKSLKDRKYLIVIDDIWSTKAWDDIKMLLPNDNNESRIMLTTRLLNVAVYVGSCSPHQMRFLNEDESWSLLQKKAFPKERCPRELEEIGKTIAKNCQGLPLTIAVIGGLLSKLEKTEDFWKHVAENVSSVVTRNDEQCLKILALSYNYLPHHLKPCFLYMGAFPEDYEIRVSKLIKLWAAEGFLRPIRSKSQEEIALEYLQDLIDRNLVLAHRQGSTGKPKSCRMHDLLRDLCVKEGHKEKFLSIVDSSMKYSSLDIHRHMSISGASLTDYYRSSPQSGINASLVSLPLVRSFLVMGVSYTKSLYFNFRLLRTLDVVEVRLFVFPKEVLELSMLRYLGLTMRGNIPSSISVLERLQTLVVHFVHIDDLSELPSEIWKMPQLRHLCFDMCVLPNGTISLFPESQLETLSIVRDLKCTDDNLKSLDNLKKLGLQYDYVFRGGPLSWYHLNNLNQLHKLEYLKCAFGVSYPLIAMFSAGKLSPPKLTFPPNLKKLTLSGSCLPWGDMTRIGSLPNLEVLKLQKLAFIGEVWEPIEGEFLELKYLKLEKMDLVQWKADDTHFPSLRSVIFKRCGRLEGISSAIGEIPTLQLIELDYCLQSAVTSANKLKEEQLNLGNDGLEVRVHSILKLHKPRMQHSAASSPQNGGTEKLPNVVQEEVTIKGENRCTLVISSGIIISTPPKNKFCDALFWA